MRLIYGDVAQWAAAYRSIGSFQGQRIDFNGMLGQFEERNPSGAAATGSGGEVLFNVAHAMMERRSEFPFDNHGVSSCDLEDGSARSRALATMMEIYQTP